MATFFKSNNGTLVGLLQGDGKNLVSNGEELKELVPHDSSFEGVEKHVPIVNREGNEVFVQVGSTLHPMLPEHFIEWIYLLTDKGAQRKTLRPGEEPKAIFYLEKEEKVLEVLAYCNKHGLWKADL